MTVLAREEAWGRQGLGNSGSLAMFTAIHSIGPVV
jgi:hypothetical protein